MSETKFKLGNVELTSNEAIAVLFECVRDLKSRLDFLEDKEGYAFVEFERNEPREEA